MSEAACAREKLEFEAAAEAIKNANSGEGSESTKMLIPDFLASGGLQFTTGAIEKDKAQNKEIVSNTMFPKQEEFDWRPAPILCKRFELTDPYMGKLPPAPRVKSKLNLLILMPSTEVNVSSEQASSSVPRVRGGKETIEATNNVVESEVDVENIERPVDLYKAIFSDDSDDEPEINSSNQVEDVQKKSEAANTALNRLIAGDFLVSLGMELGLEVPPYTKIPKNRPVLKFTDSRNLDQHSTPAEKVSSKKGEVEIQRNSQQIAGSVVSEKLCQESNSSKLSNKDVLRNRSHISVSDENSRKRLKRDKGNNSSDSELDCGRSSSRRHSRHKRHRKDREHEKRKEKYG